MYLLETTLRKLVYASVTHVNKDCPQMFYYILLCDKLEGQTVFRRKLEREGGIVWCGMKNATDF